MAMSYLERELRRGNDKDKVYADVIAGVLKARGQDVTLPKETAPVEVRRFTDEAKAALEGQGYVIHTLTGQSIASLKAAGRKFWTKWHNECPEFEALASMQSQVAIHPEQLFIPKSNNRTFVQQEEIINKFSQELGKEISGVGAIMGSAADYIDLAFTHRYVYKEYLLGQKFGYNWARTNTPKNGTFALVGFFYPVSGLDVGIWARGHGADRIFAAPLVVPKA